MNSIQRDEESVHRLTCISVSSVSAAEVIFSCLRPVVAVRPVEVFCSHAGHTVRAWNAIGAGTFEPQWVRKGQRRDEEPVISLRSSRELRELRGGDLSVLHSVVPVRPVEIFYCHAGDTVRASGGSVYSAFTSAARRSRTRR